MQQILVVEDDHLLGREVVEELTNAGFDTKLARDGNEALKILEADNIGLVYLDIMLPGDIDGYEILRRIKNTDKWKDIPVIMLSNLGQMKEIDKAMDIGATDYIVKAMIDLDRLVAIAKKHLLPS